MNLATSTIALSLYNLLATAKTPMTIGQLYQHACHGHGSQLDRVQVVNALRELCARRYVSASFPNSTIDHQKFQCSDPLNRTVRHRLREGDGWAMWQVESKDGPTLLDNVVNSPQALQLGKSII